MPTLSEGSVSAGTVGHVGGGVSVIGRHGVPKGAPCSGDAANEELASAVRDVSMRVVGKASAASKRHGQTALTQTP